LNDDARFDFEGARKDDESNFPGGLLVVSWRTVGDIIDGDEAIRPRNDDFFLVLRPNGDLFLMPLTAIRTQVDWTRYYPDAEAEKLFDSIIPAIQQFSLGDLRAKRTNYVVRISYQAVDGVYFHDCLITDLTPITALLVRLQIGGVSEASPWRPKVQPWVQKRFNIFPPER
jgi:hypothetical protein